MQCRGLGPPIENRASNQDILWGFFGILHVDIKVAILVENARLYQLVLGFVAGSLAVNFQQLGVRKRVLRILVEPFHIGMRRRRIEIEVVLFDILTVVAFTVSKSKEPFL